MSHRRADILAVAGLAVSAAVVCLPLLRHPQDLPLHTTDLLDKYAFASFNWISVHAFGQFPFRCQYLSGGYPLYTFPEDVALSPRLPLVLAFGPFAGLKLDYVVTLFLAAAGTYLLARHQMRLSVPGALVAAVTFAFGGFGLFRWLQGWLVNVRAVTFPWMLYFWWRSRRDVRWLIPCGLVMAGFLLDAKYALAVFAFFLVLWMLLRLDRDGGGSITDRLSWRRFGLLALMLAWAVPLAGLKLVPFLPHLGTHFQLGSQGRPVVLSQVLLWLIVFGALAAGPVAARLRRRPTALAAAVGIGVLALAALLVLAPYDDTPPAQRVRQVRDALVGQVSYGRMQVMAGASVPEPVGHWEEGAPVGVVAAVLVLLAILGRPRRVWRWLLLAALFLWIELGQGVPRNLLLSVRYLPGLNLLRHPREWFNLYLLFCLSVLAGHGAMVPVDVLKARAARAIPWLCVAGSLVYLTWFAWPRYRCTVATPLPAPGPWGAYHLVRREGPGLERSAALLMTRNTGVVEWGFDLKDPGARMVAPRLQHADGPPDPAWRGEVYFHDPDSPNAARLVNLTPATIRVHVDVREPGRILVINQMADPDWRVTNGTPVEHSRLLAVRLDEAGSYDVDLRYVPVRFYWGVAVSVVSLLAGSGLLWWRARRARRGGGS